MPLFYGDLFEINFLASSTSLVDSTFRIIGGLMLINESGSLEHFITNEYLVCNSRTAIFRKINNITSILSGSNNRYEKTILSNNKYLEASWIWDGINKHQINCVVEFRTENKYINSDQTCP